MAANHKDILVFVDSFHIDTSNTVAFKRLVGECFDFLLCSVVQSSGAVGATNANVLFEGRDRLGFALSIIGIEKSVSYSSELLLVGQASLLLYDVFWAACCN